MIILVLVSCLFILSSYPQQGHPREPIQPSWWRVPDQVQGQGGNLEMKKVMEEKENKLQGAVRLSTRLEKVLQRKQTMLEMVHQQLVVIPELRMKVGTDRGHDGA